MKGKKIQKETYQSRFGADGNLRQRIFYRLLPQPNDFCKKNRCALGRTLTREAGESEVIGDEKITTE